MQCIDIYQKFHLYVIASKWNIKKHYNYKKLLFQNFSMLDNVKLYEIMGDDFLTFIGRVTVMVSMVVDMILPLVAFAWWGLCVRQLFRDRGKNKKELENEKIQIGETIKRKPHNTTKSYTRTYRVWWLDIHFYEKVIWWAFDKKFHLLEFVFLI